MAIQVSMIMGIVVALVILCVSIFAFTTVISIIQNDLDNQSEETNKVIEDANTTAGDLWGIIGIVLIVGAVMAVVGMSYSFLRPGYSSTYKPKQIQPEEVEKQIETQKDKYPKIPKEIGDYKLHNVLNVDSALKTAKELRHNHYWSKIQKYPAKKYKLDPDINCAVYVSQWSRYEYDEKGKPKWRDN